MTTFFRLLKDSDKAFALESALHDYTAGRPDAERTFQVDPDKFRKVPNTPFAYWVDDSIRDLFQKLPPFESEGRTVKQGLATADDFRFVRAWWEVDADRRLDPGLGGAPDWRTELPAFQAWCRKRTHQGKYWVPFAKGGEYSPYYSDIHLVVNWKNEGEEIKNNLNEKGEVRSNVWMLKDTEKTYFFRPGVTWLRRTRRLTASIVQAGTIFSNAAQLVLETDEDASWLSLAVMNSGTFDYLIKPSVGRTGSDVQFETGMVGAVPDICSSIPTQMANIIVSQTRELVAIAARGIASGVASSRIAASWQQTDVAPASVEWNELRSGIEESIIHVLPKAAREKCEREFEDLPLNEAPQERSQIATLFDFIIGRTELRVSISHSLLLGWMVGFSPLPVVPPEVLIAPSGLPATSGNIVSEEWLRARPDAVSLPPPGSVARPTILDTEYPIPIPWDGVLAEDPDSPDDLLARVRLVLKVLHGERAEEVERELAEGLGVRDLRDYIADPMGFFDAHLKTYSKSRRKAPIYWPLSTRSGGYTVWGYYPRLTDATLYAVHELARKKAEVLDLERAELAGRKERSRAEQQRFDRVSRDAAEVRDFAQEVLRIAGLPYKPDHDDGVPICAAPLYGLFRHSLWSKYLKGIWEELQEGKYDWAHLAYALWPERVRDKARTDKSLAIAHGLEDPK